MDGPPSFNPNPPQMKTFHGQLQIWVSFLLRDHLQLRVWAGLIWNTIKHMNDTIGFQTMIIHEISVLTPFFYLVLFGLETQFNILKYLCSLWIQLLVNRGLTNYWLRQWARHPRKTLAAGCSTWMLTHSNYQTSNSIFSILVMKMVSNCCLTCSIISLPKQFKYFERKSFSVWQ